MGETQAIAIGHSRLPRDLSRLDEIARSLARSHDLKEITDIREKAEAARHYAKAASLGLKVQNKAAEVKLCAERRAGEILGQLIARGGDRKSSCHHDSLKLADIGIDYNQSARWQREAKVPEKDFQEYLATANKLGRDVSAQGLLRLERSLATKTLRKGRRSSQPSMANLPEGQFHSEPLNELVSEVQNHRHSLERSLTAFCMGTASAIDVSERRFIMRVLKEMKSLLADVQRQIGSP